MKPLVVFRRFGEVRGHAGHPSDNRGQIQMNTETAEKRAKKKEQPPLHYKPEREHPASEESFPFGVPGI